jgi:hypothetical protein
MQNNKIWLWGNVLEGRSLDLPGIGTMWCSVESAARYLHADNIMVTNDVLAKGDDPVFWSRLQDAKQITMQLTHIPLNDEGTLWDLKYVESARKIAELSLKDSRIVSVVLDDFRDLIGPSKDMTAEQLAEVYETIKRINPALELQLTRYHWENQDDLEDVRDYFDAISFWNMSTSPDYWKNDYVREVQVLSQRFQKPVYSGIYLHDYADCNGGPEGRIMPLATYKAMLPNVFHALRKNYVKGVMLLFNAWLNNEAHREGVWFLKEYIEYYLGVNTFLER